MIQYGALLRLMMIQAGACLHAKDTNWCNRNPVSIDNNLFASNSCGLIFWNWEKNRLQFGLDRCGVFKPEQGWSKNYLNYSFKLRHDQPTRLDQESLNLQTLLF